MNIFDRILNKLSKYYKGDDELEKLPEVEKIIEKETCQIEVAKLYHGMHEVSNNKELRQLLGFNPASTPWCAGFVNAIEKKCGRKGTGKLLARGYLKYGTPVDEPQKGDIVVFKRGNSNWQGHVGYFVQKDGDRILVLGGNQNSKVCYKYYPESKLLGYRRP